MVITVQSFCVKINTNWLLFKITDWTLGLLCVIVLYLLSSEKTLCCSHVPCFYESDNLLVL